MSHSAITKRRAIIPVALVGILGVACHRPVVLVPVPVAPVERIEVPIVPIPSTIEVSRADSFLVTDRTVVYIDGSATQEVADIGTYTANLIASPAGAVAQRLGDGRAAPDSSIWLSIEPTRKALGDEGYELTATRTLVRIIAASPAGLFHGVQTFRQLLPAAVEHPAAMNRRLILPSARVVDTPRFAWRGAMLDVSRHFLPAADVKRFIDLMALYKLNRLHLHLADDQGWRIEIKSWPRLAEVGGRSEIGGLPGGYYTQLQYADIVAYGRSRYITVVPEIDMPGHINAALTAYPDLKCDRQAPDPFLRIGGSSNTLCVDRDSVYTFVSDVVREIVAAAPTPYFHIGGDEVSSLTKEQYRGFIERVEGIVTAAGPRMVGWSEIAPANIHPTTILQHWTNDSSVVHVRRGGQLILSPGPHAYLDMKYDSSTILGLKWAGLIDLRTAYEWDPTTLIPGVGESSILGLEGPLWAETLVTRTDYEYMAFPRLTAIAELAWSPARSLGWDGYRRRIGAQGARLAALGVNFARVTGVDWSW